MVRLDGVAGPPQICGMPRFYHHGDKRLIFPDEGVKENAIKLVTFEQAARIAASYGLTMLNHDWWRRRCREKKFKSTKIGQRWYLRRDEVVGFIEVNIGKAT